MAGRGKALRSVRTLLGFFALALLASEAVLLKLVPEVTDTNRAFLVFSGIFVAVACLASLVALVRPSVLHGPPRPTAGTVPAQEQRTEIEDPQPEYLYDVFLSTPMSSFPTQAQYRSHRRDILRLQHTLQEVCGFRVYFSGDRRPTVKDFQVSDIGLRKDGTALENSRYFLLVLPSSLVSSVFVEAGIAIALNKPSVYFQHAEASLPFLLRNPGRPSASGPVAKVYMYAAFAEVVDCIRANGRELFE
ncbi:hypothetical protein [Streptomyces sp. AS02]|uniref:hypothetical protein n=1 Tax=Streptomyces sp. AS02 TaxID=2938946 RepID=UPI00201FFE64|nr:hypothetical protein [Streptomyces sp. AS02]MCL8012342.1 hypothetical protein [Streptomyces sp. AS02]